VVATEAGGHQLAANIGAYARAQALPLRGVAADRPQQAQAGTTFTDEQLVWLARIKDHLATSLTIAPDDFELEPFVGHGGYGRANGSFAGGLALLLEELAQELVA